LTQQVKALFVSDNEFYLKLLNVTWQELKINLPNINSAFTINVGVK